jgi:flagellar motor switch/type III secretory pathway protein FliN
VEVQSGEFPWGAVPRVSAADLAVERDARRALFALCDLKHAAAIAQDLCAATLEGFGVVQTEVSEGPLPSLGAQLQLRAGDTLLELSVEPALLDWALARVVGKPSGISRAEPLSASLRGAFEALTAEVFRRLAPGAAFAPVASGLSSRVRRLWRVDGWLRLDGASFRVRLGVSAGAALSPPGASALGALGATGSLLLRLPLVWRQLECSVADLSSLGLGDALVFGAGPPAEPPFTGNAWLCAATSERALEVSLGERGLVLRGVSRLSYEPKPMTTSDSSAASPTLEEVVLDASVVVRVEVAAVTLPAREWLNLRPGDVLSTDSVLGESVVLRSAGNEVARGTLVNVDGKLGVRITALGAFGA